MFQGIPTLHFFQHPSSVSALRADPPSPTTRGEGRDARAMRLALQTASGRAALSPQPVIGLV
ncbi:MAG: hypothetical protein EOR03_23900 [Mesorhizobium sp.]|nr:MAG: hypothetical protein EOR03_23900 [Mesorhizobium sp.]TIL65462.1 MAG: hypothetical protein E5Y77_21425 [Mesorhizobium sp.]